MRDKEQLYTRWLEQRRQVDVPNNFSLDVMATIKRETVSEEISQLDKALPQWLFRPWARWGAALGLIVLGLFRVLYVTGSLFRANLVIP